MEEKKESGLQRTRQKGTHHKRTRDSTKSKGNSPIKKSKLEENVSQQDHPMLPFKECLDKFLAENKSFFNAVKTENVALILKNSPEGGFGNCKDYYQKRSLTVWEDPRVDLLNSSWINSKKCLDIGCHEGIFTILVADRFEPKSSIGCDIDFTLINKALENRDSAIHKTDKGKSTSSPAAALFNGKAADPKKVSEILGRLSKLPKSYQVSIMEDATAAESPLLKASSVYSTATSIEKKIDSTVMFRQENYVSDLLSISEKFDTIFCMSTAKWIHLNYGDIGVKTLFYKIYASLEDNGIFIFETEPWKSYKKKKSLSPALRENYKKIKFYPHQFEDFLTTYLRFKLVQRLIPSLSKSKKGYTRTILVFQKPESS